MPRSRNIKPSFFTNDELAENEPLGRLLFAGMWTIADFKGEFEWRPKRIKANLLPYDDCDIERLAINLDKSGFIRFYSDQEKIYVKILNFDKHQNPHRNERDKGSDIPEYSDKLRQLIDLKELTINRDKSRQNRECSHSDPADSFNLIPDPLDPDSGSPLPENGSPIPEVAGGPDEPSEDEKEVNESKKQSCSAKVWQAYADAYQIRYGIQPVRNAKVNGQLAQYVQRVPVEEAPHIAAFYVKHNGSFYAAKLHPVGMLLADAEKLRTEWATKRQMTNTQARQVDQRQTNMNNVNEAIRLLEEKEARNGEQ